MGLCVSVQSVGLEISIQDDSPVDVILCAGNTKVNLEQFEETLRIALEQRGFDTSRVNIYTSTPEVFSTTGEGLEQMAKTWTKTPSDAYPARNHEKYGLILPDSQQYIYLEDGSRKKVFPLKEPRIFHGFISNMPMTNKKASATLVFSGFCPVCPAGVSSRLKWDADSGTIEGYFVTLESNPFNRSSIRASLVYISESKLASLRYGDGNSGFDNAPSVKIVAQGPWMWSGFTGYDDNEFPESNEVTLSMETVGNSIVIKHDGLTVIEYTDLENCSLGTFFVAACRPQYVGLKSAEFTLGSITPLIEAVRSPSYKPNSRRFIVDVCDTPREDFGIPAQVGELTQRLQQDGVHYIGWGLDSSKASIESFIEHNSGNGVYLNQEQDVYKKTAEYIASIVNKKITGSGDVYLIKDKKYLFSIKTD